MKALVLTIPEQPKRRHLALERLAGHGLQLHFVQGINGDVSGLRGTHTYEVDHPGTNYVIGPKTIGIFLGHYIAWAVRDAMPDEMVLILEDDAVLPPDFAARFNRVLLDTPEDWDMIFLGSCCTEGHPKTHRCGNVWDVKWPQCLHAYVMHKRAAPVLLSRCRDIYGPVDCVLKINEFYGLRVYTVLPRLVDQFETIIPP